jgi:hypothetical protein
MFNQDESFRPVARAQLRTSVLRQILPACSAAIGSGKSGSVRLIWSTRCRLTRSGTVALSATPFGRSRLRAWAVDRRGCRSEAPIPRSTRPAAEGSVRRIQVSTRGHLGCCALVPTLRTVLPGSGGVARRTWHRGRPRDPVPVGPAVHADPGGRGQAMPP